MFSDINLFDFKNRENLIKIHERLLEKRKEKIPNSGCGYESDNTVCSWAVTVLKTFESKIDIYERILSRDVDYQADAILQWLISQDLIVMNKHWWLEGESEYCKELTYLGMNANDFFFPGCADAEEILFSDFSDIAKFQLMDPKNGINIWLCLARKQLPEKGLNLNDSCFDLFFEDEQLKCVYKETCFEIKLNRKLTPPDD